ncbi:MAG TPA: monovalent cation:proton antiporter-2 (CPA2) family protein [Alphaproteobacteria bacterium]|jgi:monovalent cation:proton antiporter-2 (CPA2) family protein|nr:monovalent cation:proton antiporter-2 (CPA2) family protein [Alphaproteobacteria bacterium]
MDSALLQVFVYLAFAVVAVPVATRLGLGSVLGYLVAGAVAGPYALNLVGNTQAVGNIAQFGVVILLFLIGLEVRPALLWQLRTVIGGFGASQLVATGLVLAGAAIVLGQPWKSGLVIGFVLAMSSTAIVLQMLDEKGLRQRAVGRSAFGVLLFQDLAVIPLLALLPLAAMSDAVPGAAASDGFLAGQPSWVKVLASFGAVLGVVVGGRYMLRPIFQIIAATRLRELFTASSLLLVVGVALLMELVGLSPALGSFLAGVMLAESEYRRELETDIEPFRGLLLGIFFVTVGAGLNFGLIAAQPALLGGLVVGLMALKALILLVIGRVFRLSWREAGMLGTALSQGGEFAFVLLSLAAGMGALPGELSALLTAVVALSMAATPLAVAAYERLSRTKAKTAPEPDGKYDAGTPEVLIAGYGRFGQVVGRILNANGHRTAVLENSVEQIELLRRFGSHAFYGDASRIDLLRAAGAETARILVVAIDDRDKATEIVEIAREAFPHLKILARAFDRRHAYTLLERGAAVVERELFEGGLAMAANALEALGWRAYRAERAARLFRRHDIRLFEELRGVWGDEESYVSAVRESSPRMNYLLRADIARLAPQAADSGWDTETRYRELRDEKAAE